MAGASVADAGQAKRPPRASANEAQGKAGKVFCGFVYARAFSAFPLVNFNTPHDTQPLSWRYLPLARGRIFFVDHLSERPRAARQALAEGAAEFSTSLLIHISIPRKHELSQPIFL
jgi:hypothetical protein